VVPEETLSLKLQIVDDLDDDPASVDRLTRRLLAEIKEADVESAEIPRDPEPPPRNAKGDPITIGTIAVAVLPSLLPSLVLLVQHWILRQQDQHIKIKLGDNELEIPRDATRAELEPIIELLKSASAAGDSEKNNTI